MPRSYGEIRQLGDSERDDRLTFGMWVFLASWGMMFGGLMVAYGILRADAPAWPPPGSPHIPVGLPSLATGVLALSAATMQWAVIGVRSAHLARLVRGVAITLVLGLVFLGLQAVVWLTLWREGISTSGTYGGTFYVITWFHAAHVLVAIVLLGFVLAGALSGRYTARGFAAVRMTAMFWHFLGVCWLAIFLGLYVV